MPDMQATIVRGHLQNVSIRFQDPEFVNSQVFPILDMPTSKAKIATYNRGDMFRTGEAKKRARGTEAAIAQTKIGSLDVNTAQLAVKERITDEDLVEQGLEAGIVPPVNLVQDALEANGRRVELAKEIAVRDAVFAQTWLDGVAGGTDVAGAWASATTSTFIADMNTALKAFVAAGVGTKNLRLLLDYGTMLALKEVDAIRDKLKYTSNQSLSEETLARLLGIDKVIVATAIKSTAKEKKDGTDFTGVNIWESTATKGSAFLYKFPPVVGLKTMAAGMQPRNKMSNGAFRLSKFYRREELSAWEYETQEDNGTVITALPAGYLWKDTLVT